jgi:hypothetical protein
VSAVGCSSLFAVNVCCLLSMVATNPFDCGCQLSGVHTHKSLSHVSVPQLHGLIKLDI